MEGLIMNFRRARHHAYHRQMIVMISDVDDKKKAIELIGKKAVWVAPGKDKKELVGVVNAAHGSKGYVRVVFERGMPGQAIGSKVRIE
ncbi:50S ribosomal protein L35ae [Nanoarchaeota archaeon]